MKKIWREEIAKEKEDEREVTNRLQNLRANLKIMKLFYQLHGLLFFVIRVVNIFGFCDIYVNYPKYFFIILMYVI